MVIGRFAMLSRVAKTRVRPWSPAQRREACSEPAGSPERILTRLPVCCICCESEEMTDKRISMRGWSRS